MSGAAFAGNIFTQVERLRTYMLKQIDFDEMAVKIKLNVTKLMIELYIY